MLPMPRTKDEIKTRLRELWDGNVPLAETFWVYFLLIVIILSIFAGIDGIVGGFFALLTLAWAIFMARPVFVSADRYPGQKHWIILAKIATVLILIKLVFEGLDF